jgi:GntR family transcriptional regulator
MRYRQSRSKDTELPGRRIERTESSEPVYLRLNEQLHSLLLSRDYAEGDRFLTERQIAERYGVSRPTANKALASMVAESLLEFRKGVGTFVARPRLAYDLDTLVSFTEKAKVVGKRAATRVLQFDEVVASVAGQEVSEQLRVPPGETLFFMCRLRLANDLPVILERRWVPRRLCPALTRADLRGSLYKLWKTKYKWKLSEANQTIRAINIVGADAKLLDVQPGTACLLVSAVGFSEDEPVWWERTVYRGDAYEFHRHRAAGGRLIAF